MLLSDLDSGFLSLAMVILLVYILFAKLRTHCLSMSICYIICLLVLHLPLALHKFSFMLNSISIRELDFTSSPYSTFCIELHCDLKLCFESLIKCFRFACILHIELRNHLMELNFLCTHNLLV